MRALTEAISPARGDLKSVKVLSRNVPPSGHKHQMHTQVFMTPVLKSDRASKVRGRAWCGTRP